MVNKEEFSILVREVKFKKSKIEEKISKLEDDLKSIESRLKNLKIHENTEKSKIFLYSFFEKEFMNYLNKKKKELDEFFISKLNSINNKPLSKLKKDELLKKIIEIKEIRANYISKQLELIKEEELNYRKILSFKTVHLNDILQNYKILIEQYELIIKRLNRANIKLKILSEIESDITTVYLPDNKLLETMKMNFYYKISSEFPRKLHFLCDESLGGLESLYFNAKLFENEKTKFLSKKGKRDALRSTFQLVYLYDILSNYDIMLNKESMRYHLEKLRIISNSNGDYFLENLLKHKFDFVRKAEIFDEFESVKDSFINNFFYNENKFTKFLFTLSFKKFFKYIYFNEDYQPILTEDSEKVKIIKALTFIENNLKQNDFCGAYKQMQYFKNYKDQISKLETQLKDKIYQDYIVQSIKIHYQN